MKRKHWKIGEQHQKAFPVAMARYHVVETGFLCNVDQQPALFGVSFYNTPLDQLAGLAQTFSRKELHEIAWQHAYQQQKSGRDDESPSYPICAACALRFIAEFLNKPQGECAYLLAGAVTTGKSILLFDRNLRKDMTHPSVAVGFFETLTDFREQYWSDERT